MIDRAVPTVWVKLGLLRTRSALTAMTVAHWGYVTMVSSENRNTTVYR